VEDRAEFERVGALFLERYPEYASWGAPDPAMAPMMRFTPEVLSVLDYSKGFGHSDLVTVERGDIQDARKVPRHEWRVSPKAA
jgi:hypothetical protein